MILRDLRPQAIRFEFSALQEGVRALRVFYDPRHHAEQMAWVREARRNATPALKREIKRFAFLLDPAPELFPDIFPCAHAATFSAELERLAASSKEFEFAMVRRMLGKRLHARGEIAAIASPQAKRRLVREASLRNPSHQPLLEAFAASPSKVLRDWCALLETFYTRCLAERWDTFQTLALEDISARKELLKRFGITGMLRTLTRQVSVSGTMRKTSLQVGGAESAGVEHIFSGDSVLRLTPSYFIWPHASFIVLRRDALDVRIAYPLASPATVRPRAVAWEDAAKRFAALADPTRLQMLDLLATRNLSTREFAGLIGLSEGGVSRHLSILRDAALVTSLRDGYFVLYRRTRLAEALTMNLRGTAAGDLS